MSGTNTEIPYIGIILSDRPERRLSILREITEQGIDTDPFRFDYYPAIHDRKSVVAGISRAHKQIIKVAQMCDMESVIVMEDDVRFCGAGAFRYFLDSTPEDYDIFLSGIYTGTIKPDSTVDGFSGFHCYRIHRRYYDTFLDADESQHIDRAQEGKGRFVVCNPFAAIQWNGWSHQSRKEEDYDPLLRGRQFFNDYLKIT
jgi:hypothetical protein